MAGAHPNSLMQYAVRRTRHRAATNDWLLPMLMSCTAANADVLYADAADVLSADVLTADT